MSPNHPTSSSTDRRGAAKAEYLILSFAMAVALLVAVTLLGTKWSRVQQAATRALDEGRTPDGSAKGLPGDLLLPPEAGGTPAGQRKSEPGVRLGDRKPPRESVYDPARKDHPQRTPDPSGDQGLEGRDRTPCQEAAEEMADREQQAEQERDPQWHFKVQDAIDRLEKGDVLSDEELKYLEKMTQGSIDRYHFGAKRTFASVNEANREIGQVTDGAVRDVLAGRPVAGDDEVHRRIRENLGDPRQTGPEVEWLRRMAEDAERRAEEYERRGSPRAAQELREEAARHRRRANRLAQEGYTQDELRERVEEAVRRAVWEARDSEPLPTYGDLVSLVDQADALYQEAGRLCHEAAEAARAGRTEEARAKAREATLKRRQAQELALQLQRSIPDATTSYDRENEKHRQDALEFIFRYANGAKRVQDIVDCVSQAIDRRQAELSRRLEEAGGLNAPTDVYHPIETEKASLTDLRRELSGLPSQVSMYDVTPGQAESLIAGMLAGRRNLHGVFEECARSARPAQPR